LKNEVPGAETAPRLASRSRYTQIVGSFLKRGVSILLLVLLSGTPALASVCAALCLPGGGHHETAASATGAHVHEPEAAAPSSHHPERANALHQHSERGDAPRSVSSVRMSTPHECCSEAPAALMSRAPRTEASAALLSSAPVETAALYASVGVSSLTARVYGKSVSPPAPIRSPLVLRV
jgi:hypothetical protein